MSDHVPGVGEAAPDFSLPSTGEHPIALADFRGRQNVLLAFFPLAFSPVCTTEMCAFRDDVDRFASSNVAVVPISVDSTWSLKEFKAKHQMSLDLASDFKRDVARAYGVLHPERFFAKRAYFLIDRGGVIRWSHVESTPGERRDDAEILAQIERLRLAS
ncbi:MAG: redoxin domain-containing protein [Gemmatimonadaceae bacterium]